jgi:mRNA-degrading endonuclease RelE of RelBE toxin-antitoxin system
MRWRSSGKGKRGDVRLIYYWDKSTETLYMLYIYPKSEREDLTASQLRILSKLVREELK